MGVQEGMLAEEEVEDETKVEIDFKQTVGTRHLITFNKDMEDSESDEDEYEGGEAEGGSGGKRYVNKEKKLQPGFRANV